MNVRENKKTGSRQSAVSVVRRCFVLALGVILIAFGVAFSIKADLGTSPLTSTPYVLSLILPFSVGEMTIASHCLFVLLQILILRRDYKPFQLLQLVVAITFGFVTDFAVWVIGGLSCSGYLQQWIFCLIGICLVAVGVSLEVAAQVVTMAAEGLILTICSKVRGLKFGTMKVIFDMSLVVIACILSLVFLGGIQGVREGTLAAALLVGTLSRQVNKLLQKMRNEGLTDG